MRQQRRGARGVDHVHPPNRVMIRSRPNVQIKFAEVDDSPSLAPEMVLRGPWWMWAVALAVIAIASVWPAMWGTFLPQDDLNVTENIAMRSWTNVRALWRFAYSDLFPQFSPLGYSAFLVEYHIWHGVERHAASGYRLVNLTLHISNVLLLWMLLRKLDMRSAFVAAAIFAAHPAQVQTVAWISQQPMLLGTSFALLALTFYLRFCSVIPAPYEPRRWQLPELRWMLYALATLFFLLAIVAKPVMAVLPIMIVSLIWWERGRITRHDLAPLVPFLLMAIAVFFGAIAIFHHSPQIQEQHLTLLQRIAIVGPAMWFYGYELIRPGNFNFVYSRWNPTAWWAWLALATAFGVSMATWIARRRIGRGPFAAVVIFFAFLLPQILFLDLNQLRDSFVADSMLYPASAAIIVGVVVLVVERLLPRGQEISLASPALWIGAASVLLAVGTSYYIACDYVSAETLWSAAIVRSPESIYALDRLGVLELNRGQPNAALAHFQQAMRIDPADTRSHRDMGAYYESINEPDRAYAEYLVVLNSQPHDVESRCGLARVLAAQGDRAAALAQYQRVLIDRPEYTRALNEMAIVYIDLGQYALAIQCYQRAIQSAAGEIEPHINLANLHYRMGNYDGAIRELTEASRIDPTNFVVHVNIGSMCGQLSNITHDPSQKNTLLRESESEFRQALYWNRDSALSAFNLAKVLAYESTLDGADAGKMKEAVFYFAKACQLDPENSEYKQYFASARAHAGNHPS